MTQKHIDTIKYISDLSFQNGRENQLISILKFLKEHGFDQVNFLDFISYEHRDIESKVEELNKQEKVNLAKEENSNA